MDDPGMTWRRAIATSRLGAWLVSSLVLVGLTVTAGCGRARVQAPHPPFPPVSRWEKPLDMPLASPLVTDGSLVFAAFSDGSMTALEPNSGTAVWTRPPLTPGTVVAGPRFLVFVENSGLVWGIDRENGNAGWKTATQVRDVQTVRLDGNRVFLGGKSGLAALVASTGELLFDLEAKEVSDIDVAGETLASLEEGALVVRSRESGALRYRLSSPEGEFGAPAVFADGRVVVGSGDRLARAVSAKGRFTWRFRVGARVKDRPLDFLDGKRVGLVSFEGVFYELSLKGGDLRHRALLSSRPFAAPSLESGRIWAPVFEDEIAAIDAKNSRLLGKTRFGGGFLSPPLLVAGRILAEVAGPRRIVALEIASPN